MLLDFVYVGSRIDDIPLEEEGLEDEHPMVPEAMITAIIVPLNIYYPIHLLANSTHTLLLQLSRCRIEMLNIGSRAFNLFVPSRYHDNHETFSCTFAQYPCSREAVRHAEQVFECSADILWLVQWTTQSRFG